MLKSKNILFLLSGSIAIPKAITLIEKFINDGFTVKVACTESTFEFVSKNELEKLTGSDVIHKNFQNKLDMKHIDLGRWADLTLLCPATANTINKLAQGDGDNIVGTLFLAYELGKKPFLIAPAMNTQMYNNPATKASLDKLKSWGLFVLPTNSGPLACGEFGEGRLLEPDFLFNFIKNKFFSNKKPLKILVTAGATRESIDGVRFISNFSTGNTGAKISDFFTQLGHDVTHIRSTSAAVPKYTLDTIKFSDFNSLNYTLESSLQSKPYDVIIMTAAISDYSVDRLQSGSQSVQTKTDSKLSSADELSIHLKKNFKIINKLKSYSCNKDIKIIAFKLTKTKNSEVKANAINKILDNKDINMVIHNDLFEIENSNHKFNLYKNNKGDIKMNLDLQETCQFLNNYITEDKLSELKEAGL